MSLKVIAPIKYTDKQGQEKTTWRTLGRAWKNDDKLRINLDTIPVGPGWEGTLMVVKEDEQPRKQTAGGWAEEETEVPF